MSTERAEAMRRLTCEWLTWILLAGVSFGQSIGSISGTVEDDRGVPVEGATVYAHPIGRGMASKIPNGKTDNQGRYTIALEYGRYSVSAAKPEDGYPPLYSAFYNGFAKQVEVELSAENQSVSVDLRLGKKAGLLTGTVTDAATGKPLDANAEFRWISDPRILLSGSGITNARFKVLVPSDTPFFMKVSQSGYENWVFTRNGIAAPILLAPGETLNLDIVLEPLPHGASSR